MMTFSAAIRAKDNPPITAWNRNSWGAMNMKENSRGSVMPETMLAATPAGASDMALISADIGVNSRELVELQVIRLVVVVSLFPQIIVWVASAFGSMV